MEQSAADVTAGAVRAEMARNRASLRDVAEATGIKKTTLARRLDGTYPFNVTELVAIADFLDVPLSVLLPPLQTVA